MSLANSAKLAVAVRTVAAIVGSYVLAAAISAAVTRLLPLPRIDAVVVATLLGLLVLPFVPIWAFAARTPLRAWAGIIVPIALLAAAGWLMGAPG